MKLDFAKFALNWTNIKGIKTGYSNGFSLLKLFNLKKTIFCKNRFSKLLTYLKIRWISTSYQNHVALKMFGYNICFTRNSFWSHFNLWLSSNSIIPYIFNASLKLQAPVIHQAIYWLPLMNDNVWIGTVNIIVTASSVCYASDKLNLDPVKIISEKDRIRIVNTLFNIKLDGVLAALPKRSLRYAFFSSKFPK